MAQWLSALGFGFFLVLVSVAIHARGMAAIAGAARRASDARALAYLPLTVAALVALHLVVITLYAGAYELAAGPMGLGGFANAPDAAFADLFYLSMIAYSTLGLGDLYPQGPVRLLTGIETLNGFLLLTSSATFLFYTMRLTRPDAPQPSRDGG